MTFVADESVEIQIISKLREGGHTVLSIAEKSPGISDEAVLTIARQNTAMLITEDKDFGSLVYQKLLPHHGVILIRMPESTPDEKAKLASKAIQQSADQIKNAFSVLTEDSFRIRKI